MRSDGLVEQIEHRSPCSLGVRRAIPDTGTVAWVWVVPPVREPSGWSGSRPDAGIAALVRLLRELPDRPVQDVVDRVVATLAHDTADDVGPATKRRLASV